jgi:hypothetical protein
MKYKRLADLDLYARKSLRFTIIRPGGLTDEETDGRCELGRPQLGKVVSIVFALASNSSDGNSADILLCLTYPVDPCKSICTRGPPCSDIDIGSVIIAEEDGGRSHPSYDAQQGLVRTSLGPHGRLDAD